MTFSINSEEPQEIDIIKRKSSGEFVAGVFGERFPSTFLALRDRFQNKNNIIGQMRTAAVKKQTGVLSALHSQLANLQNPYDTTMLLRLEDAYRADPTVRVGVKKKVYFTMGRTPRNNTVFDVVDDFEFLQKILKDKDKGRLELKTAAIPPKEESPEGGKTTQTARGTPQNRGGQQSQKPVNNINVQAPPPPNMQLVPQNIGFTNDLMGLDWEQDSTGGTGEDEPRLDLDSLRRRALEVIMTKKEYVSMKNQIDAIDRKVRFRQNLFDVVRNTWLVGRGAMFIEKDKEGFPADLKVLNSFRLGDIQVDENTWKLRSVRYYDFEDPNDLVTADKMIYFTNMDDNVTPYSLFYGLSDVEPVVHDSETNRIMSEEDFKEIARSGWAAPGFLKVDTKDEDKISKMLSGLAPNILIGTNLDIDYKPVQLPNIVEKLVVLREKNEKRICQGLEVPTPLMGFENVTNRATLEFVLLSWKESVLDYKRIWLRQQVEPQWYDTLCAKILNEKSIDDLKVKLKMEFEDITFEDFAGKADILLRLYINGAIPLSKLLDELDMEDVKEEMRRIQLQQIKAQKAMQEQAHQQYMESIGEVKKLTDAQNAPRAIQDQAFEHVDVRGDELNQVTPKVKGILHENIRRRGTGQDVLHEKASIQQMTIGQMLTAKKQLEENPERSEIEDKKLELLDVLLKRAKELE